MLMGKCRDAAAGKYWRTGRSRRYGCFDWMKSECYRRMPEVREEERAPSLVLLRLMKWLPKWKRRNAITIVADTQHWQIFVFFGRQ